VSDFGQLKVSRTIHADRDVLVLEMANGLCPLPGRNFLSFNLAKTGDSDARTVLSQYALEAQ